MLYINQYGIKNAGFLKQAERALKDTGEMPTEIRFSVSFPTEQAMAFIMRFERERMMQGEYRVRKSDILAQLAWKWAHGIDIQSQDPAALVPGLWRVPERRKKRKMDGASKL